MNKYLGHIPGANYLDRIDLTDAGTDDSGTRLLELALDVGDEALAIPLCDENVRQLRLALQRWERQRRQERATQ
jgi:hypothetical protein